MEKYRPVSATSPSRHGAHTRVGAVCLQACVHTRVVLCLHVVSARFWGGGHLARGVCPALILHTRPHCKPPRSNYRPGSNYRPVLMLPASGWPWPVPHAAGTLEPCARERCAAAGPAAAAMPEGCGGDAGGHGGGGAGSHGGGGPQLSPAKPNQPRTPIPSPRTLAASPRTPLPGIPRSGAAVLAGCRGGGPAVRGPVGAESGPPQTSQPPSVSGPALAGWKVRLSVQPGSPPPPRSAGTAVSQAGLGTPRLGGGPGGAGEPWPGAARGGSCGYTGRGSHCPPLAVGSHWHPVAGGRCPWRGSLGSMRGGLGQHWGIWGGVWGFLGRVGGPLLPMTRCRIRPLGCTTLLSGGGPRGIPCWGGAGTMWGVGDMCVHVSACA